MERCVSTDILLQNNEHVSAGRSDGIRGGDESSSAGFGGEEKLDVGFKRGQR